MEPLLPLAAVVISGSSIIGAAVALILLWLIVWAIGALVPLPANVAKVINVLAVVLSVLIIINLLLSFSGNGFVAW